MGNFESVSYEYQANKSNLGAYFDLLYEEDLLIQGLYDLKSSTKIDNVKTVFNNIIMDENIYYHGTLACRAISILMNGFKDQKTVEKMNITPTDQYLGSGTYFAENIEKSIERGLYVFIAKLTKNEPFIINHMDHLNFCDYRSKNYDLIQSKECVIYNGMYDRFGYLNLKEGGENGGVKDFFTEVRIKNPKDIDLLYLLILKDYPKEKEKTRQTLVDLGVCIVFREIYCILDLNDGKIYSTFDFPHKLEINKQWSMIPSFEQILQIIKNKIKMLPYDQFRQGITDYEEDSIVLVGNLYEFNTAGSRQIHSVSSFETFDKIYKLKLEYMVFFR